MQRRGIEPLNVIKNTRREEKKLPAGNKINGFPSSLTLRPSHFMIEQYEAHGNIW